MSDEKTQWRIIGASNHFSEEREENDYYATDPVAIDKLLSVEYPQRRIWECASGGGHLSKRLQEHGFWVYSTDIVDRGYCDEIVDFLNEEPIYGIYAQPLFGRDQKAFDIITNPPYKYATEFCFKSVGIIASAVQMLYVPQTDLFRE